ncbi:MAG: hypothetical protein R3A10_14020 [Caldilineaceae bacterium]
MRPGRHRPRRRHRDGAGGQHDHASPPAGRQSARTGRRALQSGNSQRRGREGALGLAPHRTGANIHIPPCEAGHVGADNVAVLVAEDP